MFNFARIYERFQKIFISLNPSSKKRKYLRQKLSDKQKVDEYCKLHANFAFLEKSLSQKILVRKKVRICFSVMYDTFVAESLYETILEDEFFDPFILVIPDTLRGSDNMFYQLDKTYKVL